MNCARAAAGFSAAFLLTACNTVGDGFVAREWTNNMEELGITPIFPPRQDIRIGQVFLHVDARADGPHVSNRGFLQMGTYFAALDLNAELIEHYGLRPDFAMSGASAPARLSLARSVPSEITLKAVAFPGFLKATARGANIGALVPVGGLPLKAGLGLSSVDSASVTVAAAESYSLPWLQVANKLHLQDGSLDLGTGAVQRLQALSEQIPAGSSLKLTVISEVFYARSFDTTFHLSSSAALSLAKDLREGNGAEKSDLNDTTKSKLPTAAASAAAAPEATASAALDATALASAEVKRKATAYDQTINLVPQIPGVSVGVAYSATGDIGLRRTYDQPIAIGYRGLTFKVNVLGGKLVVGALTPVTTDQAFGADGDGLGVPMGRTK